MRKTTARMIGLLLMMAGVFPLYGGLMTGVMPEVSAPVRWALIVTGLAMMITGVVFYRIIKSDGEGDA